MKKFLIFWVSQAVSLFGSAVVEFALAWYLTVKTGSATVLATAMLVALLPSVILGPIIGPFVDRWNRKRTMILSDISVAVMTLILVVLFYTETIQIWHVYVAMVVRAIGQSVHYPAMQASIPMIVPDKELSRAAGLNQMLQGLITIAGPPAGAFLLGFLPMQGVLAIDIGTAIVAVGIVLTISIPQPLKAVAAVKTSIVAEMMQGFHYIWNWRGLAILVGVAAALNFFLMPVFTLLPLMVTNYLGGDVTRLGWLNSAFGVGFIAGGLLLGVWGGFKRRFITAGLGILVAGAATIVLGLISETLFVVGIAASFLVGLGLSIGNGPIMAILNSLVAKDMQGRVFALLMSVTSAMSPLGLAIAGPTADAVGIRTIYYIAGAAMMVVMAAAFFIPSLINLEKNIKAAPTEFEKT